MLRHSNFGGFSPAGVLLGHAACPLGTFPLGAYLFFGILNGRLLRKEGMLLARSKIL